MTTDVITNAEKRFVIGEGSLGQERLRAIQAVIGEIQVGCPEVLSVCTFGSTTNGKVREASDIDGWIFIDVEMLARNLNCGETNLTETHRTLIARQKYTYLTDDLESKYNDLVRSKLKNRLGLTSEQVLHLRSLPISEKIIDEYLDDLTQWDGLRQRFIERREMLFSGITVTDDPEIRGDPIRPSLGCLPMVFLLAVGHGIEPYRKTILEKLESRGEVGRRLWEEIIEFVEIFENKGNKVKEKWYPRSLEEAKTTYSG